MPRRRRGAAELDRGNGRRAEAAARPTGREYRQALCPVCGRGAGLKRVSYPSGLYGAEPGEVVNFWAETLKFDPDKPFGVIQEVGGGKGHSFRLLGYFNPDDDPDGYFPLVKARLLAAVGEWIAKGWISAEELGAVMGVLRRTPVGGIQR